MTFRGLGLKLAHMCGRYSLTLPLEEIRAHFDLVSGLNLQPRYNIAPTQMVPIISQKGLVADPGEQEESSKREDLTDARALVLMRWGLIPVWSRQPSKGAPLINARCETVTIKPSFREALRHRRCLVPADGYYEWRQSGTENRKPKKQPFRVVRKDRGLFAFAGIWEPGVGERDNFSGSFAILTQEAPPALAQLHGRAPVMLSPKSYTDWLFRPAHETNQPMNDLHLLSSEELEIYPVNPRINRVSEDDKTQVEPYREEASEQFSLF